MTAALTKHAVATAHILGVFSIHAGSSHPAPMHCSTDQGKMQAPLFSAAL